MRWFSRTGTLVRRTLGMSALLGLLGAGCGGTGADGPSGPTDSTTRDIAAYELLTTKLAQNSAEFVGKQYSYQEAHGTSLYYLSFPGFDPKLHRFDTATGARVDYTFPVGPGDAFNFRIGDSLIVTARGVRGTIQYDAYAADAPGQLVGTTSLFAPSGAKWWAYAVSGADVYIVTDNPAAPPAATTLLKWTPAKGSSTQTLFTIEAATVPAGPAPITNTSTFSILIGIYWFKILLAMCIYISLINPWLSFHC